MITKYFSKTGNFFKFVFLCLAIAFLPYCSSSDRGASSFAKRKYTKGHFSDPVAKVKTDYKSYGAATTVSPVNHLQNTGVENTPFTKTTASANNIDANSNHANRDKQNTTGGINISKSPAVYGNGNASLKESSASLADHPYDHGGGHMYQHGDGDRAGTYLLVWILCLAGAILCFLLLATLSASSVGAGGSELGAGCFLLSFSTLLFIAALVFFILWIIELTK